MLVHVNLATAIILLFYASFTIANEINCLAFQEFSCAFKNQEQLDCDLTSHPVHMYNYTINEAAKTISIAAGERIFSGTIEPISTSNGTGTLYLAKTKDEIQDTGEEHTEIISIVSYNKIIVHNIDSFIYGYCK